MIVTLWRYRVPVSQRAAFERIYGSDGEWARLYARCTGYLGGELLRVDDARDTYLTVDRWESESVYRAALLALQAERDELDDRCDALTTEETWLGVHACVPGPLLFANAA